MKTVAVLGGGPAGAMAAAKLASGGVETVLLDEKLAWEKPCGGGLTWKAYDRYPFLLDNTVPKRIVTQTGMEHPDAGSTTLDLKRPIVVFNRKDLNQLLLDRAEAAGARIVQDRVLSARRTDCGWLISTRLGELRTDYVIVAMGSRNPLRDLGCRFRPQDTMTALGYHIDLSPSRIDLQFMREFEGYIWVFPRCGGASVGIGGKGESAQQMRHRLENWMIRRGLSYDGAPFYAHMLPALTSDAWTGNRVSGSGWMAVGDAAGLVDPVTGEGIYYALRSGEMAAQALIGCGGSVGQTHIAYRDALRLEIMDDLMAGSHWAKRFFLKPFLFSAMPSRLIQLVRYSPSVTEVVQDLFAGLQSYAGLKPRLMNRATRVALEIVCRRACSAFAAHA